eukprot:3829813-Pyramimonas_sp.AAC.1
MEPLRFRNRRQPSGLGDGPKLLGPSSGRRRRSCQRALPFQARRCSLRSGIRTHLRPPLP